MPAHSASTAPLLLAAISASSFLGVFLIILQFYVELQVGNGMEKLNTFPPAAARFFSEPKVRTRPIPVELTTEGSRDSLPCPSHAPLRAQASLPLGHQPCASRAPSTNCRDTADQGFAAVPCPWSLYGPEAESARQARPFLSLRSICSSPLLHRHLSCGSHNII